VALEAVNWAGFVPAAIMVSAIPGANQLLGLRNAIRFGPMWAAVGIAARLAAFVVLIGLVVAGLGTILTQSVATLTVVKWIGVAYLVWIGITALRSRPEPVDVAAASVVDHRRVAGHEFMVAITNPKALLLFAALLPQFTTPGPDTGMQLGALGVAYLGVEAVIGAVYTGLGSVIRTGSLSARTSRRIDRITGVCFLGMAGALAVESVSAGPR
jgi:threonine/homoserine/homoserine lactone efflux protein